MREGNERGSKGLFPPVYPFVTSSLPPFPPSLPGRKKEGEREGRGSVGRKGGGEEGEKMTEKGGKGRTVEKERYCLGTHF